MRGGVRIEKNNRLCHVDSIDWSQITQDPSAPPVDNIYNRDRSICPGCQSSCPPDKTGQSYLCWNYETCQKGSVTVPNTIKVVKTPSVHVLDKIIYNIYYNGALLSTTDESL